ncbi:MAG: hypothetical protein ACK5LR_01705 [Mangrovibacterium sp.]
MSEDKNGTSIAFAICQSPQAVYGKLSFSVITPDDMEKFLL